MAAVDLVLGVLYCDDSGARVGTTVGDAVALVSGDPDVAVDDYGVNWDSASVAVVESCKL